MLSNEQIWSLTFCVGAGLGPGGVPGSLLPLTQVIPRLVMIYTNIYTSAVRNIVELHSSVFTDLSAVQARAF
eukprot:scaffold61462_cov51-Phaeocystis_antarctica.AAC.1